MEFKRASKQLPPVGIYHATYNGDHIIFQVHDGGFRVVNYHGEKDDSPQLHLVKWLDESESNQPSPPEQVGKEAIEFAQFIADNYFSYDDDYWWQNKTHYTTSELYKLFNQKWAEQGKPVVQEISDDLMKRYNDERYSIQRRSCYYDLAKDIAHKYGTKWAQQGKQEAPGLQSIVSFTIDEIKSCWGSDMSFVGCEWLLEKLRELKPATLPAKDKTNEAGERK